MRNHSGFTSLGQIDFSGTTHAGLKLNSLTTAQRDALGENGEIIYNITTNTVQKYENGAWADIGADTLALLKANNLSDLASASAARTALGLGTAATVDDSTLMHLAGAETVTGPKTFNDGALLDKGNQVFNVKAYGAVGDGVTNDTTAIDAAISAAGAGVVFFPKSTGKYIYNGSMNPAAGAVLLGANTGVTISTSAQASGHNGIININNVDNVTVRNLTIEANLNATQSYTCITSYGGTGLKLIDCAFTGTTDAFGGLVMFDGQNGSASINNTLIQGCKFYGATNALRGIHLYGRNSHYVTRTKITNSHFEGIKGPAVYIDPYSDVTGTIVTGNTFKDLLYGGSSTSVGIALYIGVQTTGQGVDTVFSNNIYSNSLTTAGHQQGVVYFYNAKGIVISNNVATGSWTTSQNTAGPALAPGRISTPSTDITITGNRITGFDAAWDPDSMKRVEVANNIVTSCGEGLSLGYGTQKHVSIHHNTLYNSPNHTFGTGILFGNSTPLKCSVTDNIVIDDRATPVMTKPIELTGNFDFSDVVVRGNRFYAPNATFTFTSPSNLLTKELGSETSPLIVEDNEVVDTTGTLAYTRQGLNIKPITNSTTTLRVTKADGTTQVLDVDTTNGRVGIGTAAPATNIHALGSSNMELRLEGSTAGQQYLSFYKSGTFKWQMYMPGSSNDLRLLSSADRFILTAGGQLGLGQTPSTSPSAWLHLAAGAAAAGNAPLKLTSGTNLTAPEAGAVEFDGTHFYGTVGSTRYQLDQQTGSGSFAPIGAQYVTLATDSNLTNERVLTGTTNQITVTDGGAGGNVTLSTLQNIHTGASPTFAGLNLGTGNLSTVGNISLDGTAARDITVAANAASSPGQALTLAGEASGAGTDLAGASLILKSGAGTGTGTSTIQFWANKPASSTGSGAGTSVNIFNMSVSATGTIQLLPANASSGSGGLTAISSQPPQATSNVNGGELRLQASSSRGTGTSIVTIYTSPAGSSGSSSNTTVERLRADGPGNVSIGTAALSTSATDGFLYIPTCAGAPTGVPTSKTGLVPMIYDTTNNNFYFYNGSWKKTTAFA
jgi:hypothetical protein